MSSIEPFSISKNIKININIPKDFVVQFDIEVITIVLRNIIINAIKYTLKNGSVNIYLESINQGYNIHIQDTGIGMNENELKKLFLYENVNSKPGTNKEKGTGIGLLLCKELMELCGGSINVNSSIGSGSDFILFIP
ncbi:MAG: sensor histidine kinase [Spirochaetia bacterium]|nr:sensor histidine kinase [Spirochaetia bacterium]